MAYGSVNDSKLEWVYPCNMLVSEVSVFDFVSQPNVDPPSKTFFLFGE
jgi:hypothetical protein